MSKGWDIFIVRTLPFVMFILLGINIICCWFGVDTTTMDMLLGNNAIYALSLYLISKSNPKYHCVYNRLMYLVLVFVPIFNAFDSKFNLIPCVETYLVIVTAIYLLSSLITSILAVRHFLSVRRKHINKNAL